MTTWSQDTAEADLAEHVAGFRKYRETMAALGMPTHAPSTVTELVEKRGWIMRERCTLPAKQVKAQSKECYYNAYRLWLKSAGRLRYCEGYVYLQDCVIPVLHGWCVDEGGRIVDPSVKQDRCAAYYGVVFRQDYVRDAWVDLRRQGMIGILGNLWCCAVEFRADAHLEPRKQETAA